MFAARKIFFIISLISFLLFLGLHLAVNYTRLNSQILKLVEEKIEKKLGEPTSIKGLSINLFTMNFTFQKVKLGLEASEYSVQLNSDQLSARLSFGIFFLGKLNLPP